MWPSTGTYWPALGGLLQDHFKILRYVTATWSTHSRSPRICVPQPWLHSGLSSPGSPHTLKKPAGTQVLLLELLAECSKLNFCSNIYSILYPCFERSCSWALLHTQTSGGHAINTILTSGLACSMDAPNTSIFFSHFYFPWGLDKAPW